MTSEAAIKPNEEKLTKKPCMHMNDLIGQSKFMKLSRDRESQIELELRERKLKEKNEIKKICFWTKLTRHHRRFHC